jgi:hypothetical protein
VASSSCATAIQVSPSRPLGGFGSTYYQHAVEIEVYVEDGDAAARDWFPISLSVVSRR